MLCFSCKNEYQDSTHLFREVKSKHSNIHFRNVIPENKLTNFFFYEYVYNGGGVATGDLNGDGLADIYFTSNLHENALYINQGDLTFKETAKESGVTGNRGWTTGVNMIDINNDNLLDLYICKSGPYDKEEYIQNELYINQGPDKNGIPVFKESAKEFGLSDASYSIQSAFLDFDLDGDLDMYLMNHNPQTFAIGNTEKFSPLGDKFYVNENGRFVDKTKAVGIYSNAVSYGLGLGVGDLNNDGWPDLYVSNDYDEPDYFYLNKKDGTFQEVVKKSTNHISNFAMGNDIADFDNDGFADILTLDMVSEDNYGMKTSMASMNPQKFEDNVANGKHFQYMYNTLQRHTTFVDAKGVPHFSEIGQLAGISNTDWSWAPLMADFDNDGLKDIFITNGIKRDFRNKDHFKYVQDFKNKNSDALTNPEKINSLVNNTPQRPQKNYFYRNTGSFRFENTSDAWVNNPKKTFSNGAAYADFDNDGDLDLVINNVDEEALILENTSENSTNHYLRLQLNGPGKNVHGIGAKVEVYTAIGMQMVENYSVRGYQSSVQPGIHIGLGDQSKIDSLRVIWPGGQMQVLANPPVNTILEIEYQKGKLIPYKGNQEKNLRFSLKEIEPSFYHKENNYDDYKKQVLLPHKLSQFGPAIAVGDINGDGMDDLYFGQSTGEISHLYIQLKDGSFKHSQAFEKEAIYEDVDAAFFDIDKDGDLDLYVASGGNEFEPGSSQYKDRLYENVRGKFILRPDLLPKHLNISSSSIQIQDYDKDGYPDVFIGGRHVPHHYPSPASSYLLHNNKGIFEDITSSIIPDLEKIGLVTDAVWSDFDNDDDMDLCIVGEWMAPTFFKNNNGKFQKIESSLGQLTGWYFTVSSADIDGDGDQDFLLGNLGENYKYKASEAEPFEVYYHDFDDNGQKDLVLGYYNFGDLFPVRGRECSSQQMPEIKKISPTYHDFGSSTVTDIYGKEKLGEALHLSAYNFSSGVLKNNGNDDFDFIPFPDLTQLSSINTILSKDLNGDEQAELILAGNLFTSEIETPRNDAGYGLVLSHKGDFKFEPVQAAQSGLFLPSDVKKLRFIKIGGDVMLVACSNNGPLEFYQIQQNSKAYKDSQTAKPIQ